jgi:hypothetical protein
MTNSPATTWIRIGLFTLPVYGLLTLWSTIGAQPNAAVDPEGWARFVSSPAYLSSHVLGSSGGTILAIFGTFALGACLATSRSPRLGLAAMVVAAAGQALLLGGGAVSTFAIPAMGQAYLEGVEEVATMPFPTAMSIFVLGGMLLALVGNVLLGIAAWRSGILPRGAGALWIAAWVVFVVLGAALGMATTGASLPHPPIGASLMAISGGWIAWAAMRRPAVVRQPQPSPVESPPQRLAFKKVSTALTRRCDSSSAVKPSLAKTALMCFSTARSDR